MKVGTMDEGWGQASPLAVQVWTANLARLVSSLLCSNSLVLSIFESSAAAVCSARVDIDFLSASTSRCSSVLSCFVLGINLKPVVSLFSTPLLVARRSNSPFGISYTMNHKIFKGGGNGGFVSANLGLGVAPY